MQQSLVVLTRQDLPQQSQNTFRFTSKLAVRISLQNHHTQLKSFKWKMWTP